MSGNAPNFAELLASAKSSAIHLEMRDSYEPDGPNFLAWRETGTLAGFGEGSRWHSLIGSAVARGVTVRRARIVYEPVTDYIRFEHAVISLHNIPAGEPVRWLPRRHASDLALPGNDFWVFDGRLVRFHHFSGDGHSLDEEFSEDPDVIKLCTTAFDAVWERADHADYQPA
ncbi:hypothetical protein Acsp04_60740 [Actinomadura sp. NBRC 104425]|uniref:DUF6879 family protein n=1 Tax=Actinomadura sp. NBRC 104425 TaxID=3032204 RepID=UPI00249FD9CA|nr:DUF6879 family protein [Actinomadura sp. NBRC 104425]GLZ15839.1 hypothetical protein Acsp04_60740 [Actinomadura sp. NBRC 104425]